MATLQIHLRDDLQQLVAARAKECGFKTLEEYVVALLCVECHEEMADEELEELLLKRLDSGPGIELTPEWKARFLEEFAQRRHGL